MKQRSDAISKFPTVPREIKEEDENPYKALGLTQYSLVYKYFGIPIDRQFELDILSFNMLVRDALCMKLSETEEGQKYLDDAWRFKQTKPDRQKLREQFG